VHTFLWQRSVLTDLGTLPGVTSGGPNDINDNGVVTGISENGSIDPTTGLPEYDAVVWKNGQIINLGTFGGNWSYANALNNEGEVAGQGPVNDWFLTTQILATSSASCPAAARARSMRGPKKSASLETRTKRLRERVC
jgi:probable HAF family extracellular repeat protein